MNIVTPMASTAFSKRLNTMNSVGVGILDTNLCVDVHTYMGVCEWCAVCSTISMQIGIPYSGKFFVRNKFLCFRNQMPTRENLNPQKSLYQYFRPVQVLQSHKGPLSTTASPTVANKVSQQVAAYYAHSTSLCTHSRGQ